MEYQVQCQVSSFESLRAFSRISKKDFKKTIKFLKTEQLSSFTWPEMFFFIKNIVYPSFIIKIISCHLIAA